MKRMLNRLVRIDNWEKEEKSFVIAMMIMVVFNFILVVFTLNK